MPDPFLEAARSSIDPFLAAAQSVAAPSSPSISSNDPFLKAASEPEKKPSATVLQKTQAALGRGVKEGGRLLTGAAKGMASVAPYDLHVDETGKVELRDISGEIETRRQNVVGTIDKYADAFMHASDEDRQPGNMVERLVYGLVEFIPLAPVYEVLGGPGAAVVDDALATIARRFGPTIAKKVAEKIPAAAYKAGKYLGEVGAHGLREGAMGATAEMADDPSKALDTGLAFGAYSMAFKGLLKDPIKAVKKATWDAPTPKIVDPFEKAAGVETANQKFEREQGFERPSKGALDEAGRTTGWQGPPVHPDWFEGMDPSAAAKKAAGKTEELHSLGSMFSTKEAREARKTEVDAYLRGNGYEVVGVQEHPRHGDLFWFTDPKTGSTLLMPLEDMTPEGIEAHVKESRDKFFPAAEAHSLASIFSKKPDKWSPDEHIQVGAALGHTEPQETFYDFALSRLEEKSSAAHNAFIYSRKMGQQVRDFLDLNGIPALTRLGVADESFEHGGAHLAAPRISDDLIAKVMGADYKDWRKKSMFMGVLVKDRILAGHEYNVKLRNDALMESQRVAGEVRTVEENIMLYEHEHQGTLKVEQEEHLQKLYEQRSELQREQAQYDSKAQEQHKIVDAIEKKHDIKQMDWDVRNAIRRNYVEWKGKDGEVIARIDDVQGKINAWNHPETGVTEYLNRIWKDVKGLGQDEELTETGTLGKYTGARLSLVTKGEKSMSAATGKKLKEEDSTPSLDEYVSGKIESALGEDARHAAKQGTADVGRDPKDHRAYFTGDYSLSMEKNLNNTIRPRLEKSTKEKLYQALESKGVVKFDEVTAKDILPEGVEWRKWPVKVERPSSAADPAAGGYQRTALVPRDMWVRSDAKSDLEGVLNVGVNMKPLFFTQFATRVQLLQVVDFVTHAKNLLSEVSRAQGKKGMDVATRIPLLAQGDAVARINKVFAEVRSDSPEIRAEMASLARLGVLRPAHGQDAILPTGKWLWEIDTSSRLLMNRFYDNLVAKGKVTNSVTARRNFINQVGQYNDRFMQPWMRWARRVGISPFVVAGRTFNRNATRALTGEHGAQATSQEKDTDMRRLNLMTAAMSATIPMMINAATTGNPLGRPGTPLFGVDLGRKEKDDGTHDVIDLGQISGLARATREWGVADTYQGLRAGQTPEQIAAKAGKSMVRGRTHPWEGPGAAFIENLKEGPKKAVEKINPMLFTPLGANKYGFAETKLSPESGERTPLSRVGTAIDTVLSSPAGAFGYKDVRAPRSAAEQYVTEHRFKTGELTEDKMAHRKIREHAEALLKEDEDKGREYLQKQIDAEKIEADYAERIVKELPLSKLQRGFASLSAKHEGDTALEAYKLATIHEKARLFRQLEQKIGNQEEKISAKQMDALTAFLDKAHAELTKALAERKITPEEIYEKE